MFPGIKLEVPLMVPEDLKHSTTDCKHLHKDATDYIKWVVHHRTQNIFSAQWLFQAPKEIWLTYFIDTAANEHIISSRECAREY